MQKYPELWRPARWITGGAVLISILCLVVSGFGFFHLYEWSISSLSQGVWGSIAKGLIAILAIVACLGFTAVLSYGLSLVLMEHFFDVLVTAVELNMGRARPKGAGLSLPIILVDACRSLLTLLAINSICFLIGWIPVVGSGLSFLSALWFNSFYLGSEMLGYPLALQGLRRKNRIQLAKKHWPMVRGLGASALILGTVPFLFPFLLAPVLVGATVWVHSSVLEGRSHLGDINKLGVK